MTNCCDEERPCLTLLMQFCSLFLFGFLLLHVYVTFSEKGRGWDRGIWEEGGRGGGGGVRQGTSIEFDPLANKHME